MPFSIPTSFSQYLRKGVAFSNRILPKEPWEYLTPGLERIFPSEKPRRILLGPNRGVSWTIPRAQQGTTNQDLRSRFLFYKMLLGIYELDVQRAIGRLVRPGDICFDIGANVGFFSLLLSKLNQGAPVFAFEPLEQNLSFLQRALELNPTHSKIEIVKKAASDQEGIAEFLCPINGVLGQFPETGPIFGEIETYSIQIIDHFFENTRSETERASDAKKLMARIKSGHILEVINDIERWRREIPAQYEKHQERIDYIAGYFRTHSYRFQFKVTEVSTIRIDQEIQEGRLPAPQFVKIDVEGAELRVLKGMLQTLKKHRPILYIELHGKKVAQETQAFLDALGAYELRDLKEQPIGRLKKQREVVCLPRASS